MSHFVKFKRATCPICSAVSLINPKDINREEFKDSIKIIKTNKTAICTSCKTLKKDYISVIEISIDSKTVDIDKLTAEMVENLPRTGNIYLLPKNILNEEDELVKNNSTVFMDERSIKYIMESYGMDLDESSNKPIINSPYNQTMH